MDTLWLFLGMVCVGLGMYVVGLQHGYNHGLRIAIHQVHAALQAEKRA